MTTSTGTKPNSKLSKSNSGTPIADSMTETLHESVDTLSGHAVTAEQKLRNTAASSAETMEQKQQQVKQYWEQSAVGKYTKENPVATAGIAFAAGMLLTTFLRRK
ncbi:DUF883 domain-containing protein [uncultured Paraglaciecola sp.]|uniref:DUF883 domain-containing protein n=1 Tax=uncultured Paraglaciecola sp. TaxID=1765024 RepID=UPI0030D77C42